MASIPNSLNPIKPPTKMMPEGSRKVCVMNGSCQLDQVVKGEWVNIKVLPESGLPKGVYQLAEATKPDTGKDGKESAYSGQVLHVDSKAVYQLSGKGIVEHPRSAFADLEAKGDKIVVGRTYTVGYVNGKGTVSHGQAASLAQQQQRSASKGGGISL
ncbi:conjugal transfer protein TraB [Salmonella enterica subsp. enterica serovar Typhimurium]|nr:conjugal transfer protein TraB [Salmonella enterica subsp. enterica serovar Enteritidis]EDA7036765.1 conjugal transfer protein TraB [Salmonella enterica subsp. enterica serovar Typhimurium]HEA2371475.1 conjugal transfer protein TraB [Escherichia coli]